MESKARPYLTAALLCEKILVEQDGSLSVIRIADKIQIQMQGPPGIQQFQPPPGVPIIPVFDLTCLVALKSGPAIGDYTLRLTFVAPSGNIQGNPVQQPVKLLGKDHGQNFIVKFYISATEEGLHWVLVSLDEMELTRIPLIVVRSIEPHQPT